MTYPTSDARQAPRDRPDVSLGTTRFAGAGVWGLDLSSGLTGRRRERTGRLPVVQGDRGRLPFADDTFDAVTCGQNFHHYPHTESRPLRAWPDTSNRSDLGFLCRRPPLSRRAC
ncbi:MAG: class I SAM-dependent methyltransferase [Gemmataceae bacterium]|nr:class I SAM-dependent methyltransferase [Gemmataceae bacterium]